MRYLALLALLLPGAALAQPAAPYGPGPCPMGASSCVTTATGSTTSRTLAARAADRVNIKDFGAQGDAVGFSDGAISSGLSAFTSNSATFTATDVGKSIIVNGAGTAAGALSTTISAFVSAHSVTLAASASATVSGGLYTYGTDDSAAIALAMARASAIYTAGSQITLYAPAGNYFVQGTSLPTFRTPVALVGDGSLKTNFIVAPTYSGAVFSWSECWQGGTAWPFNGNTVVISNQYAGPSVKGVTVIGNRLASVAQSAFVFYDRNEHVVMDDVQALYVKGRGIQTGVLKNSTESYVWESRFSNIKLFNDGDTGAPVFEFGSVGVDQAANMNVVTTVDIYAPYGTGLWIHNNNANTPSSGFQLTNMRVEGLENNAPGIAADLIRIGDTSDTGITHDVYFHNLAAINPYASYAGLRLTAASSALQPWNIAVESGGISGGAAGLGKGLMIDAGRKIYMQFANISTSDTDLTIGASTLTAGPIFLDGSGNEIQWTTSIDATAYTYVRFPGSRFGAPTSNNTSTFVSAQAPDGTVNFGNTRGTNSTDWQTFRFAANQAATGANSTISGGIDNRASQTGAVVGGGSQNTNAAFYGTVAGGNSNQVTGQFSAIGGGTGISLSGQYSAAPGGLNTTDRGNAGASVWGSGDLAVQGDAQSAVYVLRGTGASTAAIRLTTDNFTVGSADCVNLPNNTAYQLVLDIVAFDHTTVTKNEAWSLWSGLLTRGANAASTAVTMATTPTPITNGTVTGSAIAVTADTTNGCLNISFTPPSANTDTWNAVARVRTVEVQ